MTWRPPISQAYLQTQKALHAMPRGYGGRGDVWAPTVMEIATRSRAFSILDYGAGQGSLGVALRLLGRVCRDYDPAREGMNSRPDFADLVTCTDVLEHIEPDRLDAVLAHLRSLARKAVFVVIATRPSNKLLPDGRNAHLIIEDDAWWEDRVLAAGFSLQAPPQVLPTKMPGACWIGVLTP